MKSRYSRQVTLRFAIWKVLNRPCGAEFRCRSKNREDPPLKRITNLNQSPIKAVPAQFGDWRLFLSPRLALRLFLDLQSGRALHLLRKRPQLGKDDRQIFSDCRMNVHGALDDRV